MKKIFLILILGLILGSILEFSLAFEVIWKEEPITVCPPGILGKQPTDRCEFPSLIDIFTEIIDLIMTVSPYILVALLILGGIVYLLSPFKPKEMIATGHRYIQWAVLGYIILLLITLVFTFISAILGGPSQP